MAHGWHDRAEWQTTDDPLRKLHRYLHPEAYDFRASEVLAWAASRDPELAGEARRVHAAVLHDIVGDAEVDRLTPGRQP